jgi:hypothetical protein
MSRILNTLAARLVVAIHLGFLAFVLLGSLLLRYWPGVIWLHLPLVAWGVLVVLMSWECPLTTLEKYLLRAAGKPPYAGGFIEHYLSRWLFPRGLPRPAQIGLGTFLLLVNIAAYGACLLALP